MEEENPWWWCVRPKCSFKCKTSAIRRTLTWCYGINSFAIGVGFLPQSVFNVVTFVVMHQFFHRLCELSHRLSAEIIPTPRVTTCLEKEGSVSQSNLRTKRPPCQSLQLTNLIYERVTERSVDMVMHQHVECHPCSNILYTWCYFFPKNPASACLSLTLTPPTCCRTPLKTPAVPSRSPAETNPSVRPTNVACKQDITKHCRGSAEGMNSLTLYKTYYGPRLNRSRRSRRLRRSSHALSH